MNKNSFEPDEAMTHIREAVRTYPKAGMFELYQEGFSSPFEILVSCIISIRTYDEVMLPKVCNLFKLGHTPQQVSDLSVAQIDQVIAACTFHERKAQQIHDIAHCIVNVYDGVLPCDKEVLLSFKRVGPKCTNLVLGIGCGQPQIGVDIHVHRITNRWGYVQGKSAEHTMHALEAKLPLKYWVKINELLIFRGINKATVI